MTSTIKVNTVTTESGSTLTLGESGKTVTLASGASQSGFGREGSVNWQTGSIKTTTFTAANGEGYFVDTSSGAVTANLPAGSAGAIVAFSDYTRTFNTHNLTVSPNGSEKIGGVAENLILSVDGQALTLVYVDSTEGWINVQNAEDTETGRAPFIQATGGTVTCCGNFKIHTFTGPGTFQVTNTALVAANNQLDYLVVAGGGGGGGYSGGGGGAGGFRVSNDTCMPAPQTSPLANPTGITATITSFPITVGGGGAAGPYPPGCGSPGVKGNDSVFSTITSTGGGFGMSFGNPPNAGGPGGSGGGSAGDGPGSASYTTGGTGNDPSVSPAQGTNGGRGVHRGAVGNAGGGGGGAAAAGTDSNNPSSPGGFAAGAGGGGSFVVSAGFAGCNGEAGPVSGARYFAGGGGAGSSNGGSSASGGAGGVGGGGDGTSNKPSCGATTVGTVNTGGGGAGAASSCSTPKKATAGGSGIVIIRYKFQ
jgi:hypothetical protein